MALTYTAAIQNRIALLVWGQQNAGLSTDEKVMLDNTWTIGTPGGAAGDALNRINRFGQWFEQVTSMTAPATFDDWWVAETAYILVKSVRAREKHDVFAQDRQRAEDDALMSYSSTDPNSTTITGQTMTVPGIRWYVVDHCIRRKPRFFPSPTSIDSQIGYMLNYVWNLTPFNFRKRQCTVRIDRAVVTIGTWVNASKTLTETAAFNLFPASESLTNAPAIFAAIGGTNVIVTPYQIATRVSDNAVTLAVSLSGTAADLTAADIAGIAYAVRVFGLAVNETMDSTNVRQFTYSDDTDQKLTWCSADDFAALRARYGSTTGRPIAFRIEVRGSTLLWHLLPLPDQAYSLFGEVIAAGPAAITVDTELTTQMSRFPPEFGPVIRDGVLARVLKAHNLPDGETKWAEVKIQADNLLAVYEDTGRSDDEQAIRDVYHDLSCQYGNSESMLGGRM